MTDPTIQRRVEGLDTLRALAILLVIIAHYPKPAGSVAIRMLNFGWIGVDLFFVLSGYLIGGQLFAAQSRGLEPSLRSFYVRRFLRTLPNYYVVLAIYAILPAVTGFAALSPPWKFLVFLQNMGVPSTFEPSWSLCVEEHFYLVFPLAALVVVRSRWRGMVPALFGGILLAQIALRCAIWLAARPDLLSDPQASGVYMGSFYFPTYCRLDGIILGVGIAALKWFRPALWQRLMQRGGLVLTLSGLFLALSAIAFFKRYSFPCSTLGFSLISITFALLTISVLSGDGSLGRWKIPGAQTIALLSYSIYLTHSLALECTSWIARSQGLSMISAPLITMAVALIALFSLLLNRLVEKPFLALRDRLFDHGKTAGRQPATVPEQLPIRG